MATTTVKLELVEETIKDLGKLQAAMAKARVPKMYEATVAEMTSNVNNSLKLLKIAQLEYVSADAGDLEVASKKLIFVGRVAHRRVMVPTIQFYRAVGIFK